METTVYSKKTHWLLDNAADGHVCNQKHFFTSYRDDPTSITGATALTTWPGKGTVCLKLALLDDGSLGCMLTLTNVWYRPQCSVNLVSQARLNDAGVFYDNKEWTLYLARREATSKQTIGYVPRVNNSFIFSTIEDQDSMAVRLTHDGTSSSDQDHLLYQWPEQAIYKMSGSIKLSAWHARLGHLNLTYTTKYLKDLNIPYTNDVLEDFYCHSCQMAKATKKYNQTPQTRATEPFQEVHTNMVGSIKPIGFLKEVYFFTFTDSYSRYTHVYTAVCKHE